MVSLTTLIALATRWPKVLDLRARFVVRLDLVLALDFLAAGLRAFRVFKTLVLVRFTADFLAAFLRAFFAIGFPPVLPINGPSIETRRTGRQRVLDLLATDRVFVAGFHMPFPGLGWIERANGGYRWVPHSYQMNL